MPRNPDLPCAGCGKLMWRSKSSLPAGQATCHPCRGVGGYVHGQTHGVSRYKRGCRCDSCKAAKTAEMREYAAKVKERDGISLTQKYRPRTVDLACVGCGVPVGGSVKKDDPHCMTCRTQVRRSQARRRASLTRLQRAAVGKDGGGRIWVQGPCAVCSQQFLSPGLASRYCSPACRSVGGRVGKWISTQNRLTIYERDDWTCQLCSDPVDPALHHLDDWAASLDHIVPRSKGGTHEPENLRLAHRWCNSVRGDDSYYTADDLAA